MFREEFKDPNRYRIEDGTYCIDLALNNLLQLFDRRDPSPFRERDLDEDFARYLLLSMHELPKAAPVKVVIKMPEHNPSYVRTSEIEEAIRNYFQFEMQNVMNQKETLFREGQIALVIGLGFLVVSTILHGMIAKSDGAVIAVLREGLSLVPWVALWRPINIFLYEWWPYNDKIRIYQRLCQVSAEVITD